jgi:hypothetical protein
MPHAYLVPIAELPRYAITSAFLDQFEPRPIEILITAGGALGTMKLQWRLLGDADWSIEIASSPLTSWVLTLDEAFAILTFAAGSYVANSTYVVNELGAVTVAGGGISTLTAARYDVRETESQATTDLCLGWMKPAVVPPLVSWGADIRGQYAFVLRGRLKRRLGLSSQQASVADENILLSEEKAEAWFKAVGAEEIEPVDLVDSSDDGAPGSSSSELLMPVSDDPIGF